MPRECLKIIESKSKVRNSRSKPVVAKVKYSHTSPPVSLPSVSELKDMVKALLLDKKNQSQAPAHQTPHPFGKLPRLTPLPTEGYDLVRLSPPEVVLHIKAPQDSFYLIFSSKVMNRGIPSVTRTRCFLLNNGKHETFQPPVVQVQSQNPTSEPVVDPVSAPRPNQQTSIPFPSRRGGNND
ncbi:hypothetical protein Tco_0652614 [Tanacetum coccineum]|uniref:Uncharacterized protein n=1 Tax=Tanacetum coccineum TaxID=301880 RepID=A0ABQ4WYI3_9ASTR